MSDIGISIGLDTGDAKRDSAAYVGYLKDIIDIAVKLEDKSRALNKALGATTQSLGANAKKHTTFSTAVNKSDASLNRLKDRLTKVQGNMKGYENTLAKAAGGNRKVDTAIKGTNTGLDRQASKLKSTSAGWKLMRTAMATVGTVALVSSLKSTTVELEGIRAAMGAVFGKGQAAAEFQFITENALRLGVSLKVLAKDYTSLAAAAKGTTLEGQGTRDIFLAVAESSRALSLSTVDTSRAMRAISQMMSKGTISSEELKQQLGEVLPGAMQSAARAIGKTTMELTKMLEQGKLMSDDFIPKFAKQLKNDIPLTAGALATVGASLGRLSVTYELFQDKVAQNGFADALRNMSNELAVFLNSAEADQLAKDLGAGFKVIGEALVGVIKALPGMVSGIKAVYSQLEPLKPLISLIVDNLDIIVYAFAAAFGAKTLGSIASAGEGVLALSKTLSTTSVGLTGLSGKIGLVTKGFTALAAAAAIGFSIGTWLNQFTIVQVAGTYMVQEILKAIDILKTGGEAVWIYLSNAAGYATKGITKFFVDTFNAIIEKMTGLANALNFNGIFDGLIEGLAPLSEGLTGTSEQLQIGMDKNKVAAAALTKNYDALKKRLTVINKSFAEQRKYLKSVEKGTKKLSTAEKKAISSKLKDNKAQKAALELRNKIAKAMQAQVKLFDPLKKARETFAEGSKDLNFLMEQGEINAGQFATGMNNLGEAYVKAAAKANKSKFSSSIDAAEQATARLGKAWDGLGNKLTGAFSGAAKEIKVLAKQHEDYTAQSKVNTDQLAQAQAQVSLGVEGSADKVLRITENQGKLDAANTQAKLGQTSAIFSATAAGFKEGSKAAQAFELAASLAALAQAAVAVASAGTGDPYTAIPRVIAMIGLMSSIGLNLGGGGGGGGGSSAPTAEEQAAQGKGTILGDSDAVSNSIAKGLDILDNNDVFQIRELKLLNEQFNSLSSHIAKLAKTVVVGLSTGKIEFDDLGDLSSNNGVADFANDMLTKALGLDSAQSVLNGIADVGSEVFGLFGDIGDFFGDLGQSVTSFADKITGDLISGITDNIFGGKVKARTVASGIQIGKQTYENVLDGLDAVAYQVVKFKQKRGFKYRTSYKTFFNDLNSDATSDIQKVVMALGSTVSTTMDLLGIELENDLNDFVVNIGKIQTSGRSAEDIQNQFTAIFSAMGDSMVEFVLPSMIEFQKLGEGLLETAVRVAAETQLFKSSLDLLGIDADRLTTGSVVDVIIKGYNTESNGGGTTNHYYTSEPGVSTDYDSPDYYRDTEDFQNFLEGVRSYGYYMTQESLNVTQLASTFVTDIQNIFTALGGDDIGKGAELFAEKVQLFTTNVLKGTEILALTVGSSAERVAMAVASTHNMDLIFADYTVEGFNEIFDQVKNTLSAQEIITWMDAGIALAEFNGYMEEFENLIDTTLKPLISVTEAAQKALQGISKEMADIVSFRGAGDEGLTVAKDAFTTANRQPEFGGLERSVANAEVFAELAQAYLTEVERFYDEQMAAIGAAKDSLQEQIDLAKTLQDNITEVMTTLDSDIKKLVEGAEGFDVAGARASELNSLILQMLTAASLSTQEQIDLIGKTQKAIMSNYEAQKDALKKVQEAEMTLLQEAFDARVTQEEELASLQTDLAEAQVAAAQAVSDAQNTVLNNAAQASFDSANEMFELWQGAAESISEFLGGLDLSDLSTLSASERLSSAEGNFQTTLSAAQGGDANAAAELAEVSTAYLEEARSFFASSGEYTDIFNLVKDSVESVEALALAADAPELITFGEESIVSAVEEANAELQLITQSVVNLMNAMQDGSTSEQLQDKITATEQLNLDALEALRVTSLAQLQALDLVANALESSIASDLAGYEEDMLALTVVEAELLHDVSLALTIIADQTKTFATDVEEGMRQAFIEQSGIQSFNTNRTIDVIEGYQEDAQDYYDQYYQRDDDAQVAAQERAATTDSKMDTLIDLFAEFVNTSQGGGGGLVIQAGSDGIATV